MARLLARRVHEPHADDGALIVWRWFDIPTPDGRETYLSRLYMLRLGWGAMLHWIQRPDGDRDLHDHPWPFVSIVVRGGYLEHTQMPDGSVRARWIGRWRWNVKRAGDAHRIVEVLPGTVTLVFTGRRSRGWGFHTAEGWVPWREYIARRA